MLEIKSQASLIFPGNAQWRKGLDSTPCTPQNPAMSYTYRAIPLITGFGGQTTLWRRLRRLKLAPVVSHAEGHGIYRRNSRLVAFSIPLAAGRELSVRSNLHRSSYMWTTYVEVTAGPRISVLSCSPTVCSVLRQFV